jgi:2Fe-2S type ferredoxin
MVDLVAFGIAAGLVSVLVVLHVAKGTEWQSNPDISQELLEKRASTVPETAFPEPMNRAMGGGGGAVAIESDDAAGEESGELEEADEDSDDPAAIPDDEVEYYEVEFVKEGETIELANNETILDQAEEDGMDLPYACRQGQCVSCAGKITDGPAEDHIVHFEQETLAEDEMDKGYTLTCVAYPIADFSIETGEAP